MLRYFLWPALPLKSCVFVNPGVEASKKEEIIFKYQM